MKTNKYIFSISVFASILLSQLAASAKDAANIETSEATNPETQIVILTAEIEIFASQYKSTYMNLLKTRQLARDPETSPDKMKLLSDRIGFLEEETRAAKDQLREAMLTLTDYRSNMNNAAQQGAAANP